MEPYKFNIALVTLNHLGRNLYRSFITILGEAISNSWDADATEVNIEISRENNCLLIYDNGVGMTDQDFRNKFLHIGYSKRGEGTFLSREKKRHFIGRKGIGKLALLSCSKRLSILSKAAGANVIGGIIDNTELDQAIKDSQSTESYTLPLATQDLINKYQRRLGEHGTLLLFENLNDGIRNRIEYIRQQIALYFRFALVDQSFTIKVNGKEIGVEELGALAAKTQFVWKTSDFNDPYLGTLCELKEEPMTLERKGLFHGFIASVEKPSNLKIVGAPDERMSIDLFVNGRLRERDILKRIGGSSSTRIATSYLYGQIHCDKLDDGGSEDRFTSSREGVLDDDPIMESLKQELQGTLEQIISEWDKLRRKHREEGDPEDTSITPKARQAEALFNILSKDYDSIAEKQIKQWLTEIQADAKYNLESYGDCFIAENLMRRHIEHHSLPLSSDDEERAIDSKKYEERRVAEIKYTTPIRISQDLLYYAGAPCIFRTAFGGHSPHKERFIPLRNAVAHTARLTDLAKQDLTEEVVKIKTAIIQAYGG